MNGRAIEGQGHRRLPLGDWSRRLVEGNNRIAAFVAAALAIFYLLTAAGNLSETDDVYAFAYRAENFAWDHFSDPRLLLYHLVMRLLYLGSSVVGWDLPALSLMRAVSSLCAAVSLVLVARIAAQSLRLSPVASVLAACLLAVCYGFWRYAAEAEVYAPATVLILLVFHGLSKGGGGPLQGLLHGMAWGGLAGLTVLVYQPAAIPLLFAFPWLLFARERIAGLAAYVVAAGCVTAGGYLIAYLIYWPEILSPSGLSHFLAQRSGEFIVPPLSLWTIVVSIIRAAFALGHDVASANWIFAFDALSGLIRRAFSANVISEEVFLAKKAGLMVYLPLITFPVLLALAGWALWSARSFRPALFCQRPVLVILLWAVVDGAIVGRLNPAGVEAWIMLLPPLVLLFAAFVIEVCVRSGKAPLVGAFIAVLLLHNAVGGMALVFDPQGEYDRVKGAWIVDEAGDNDLVIVAGNAGLVEALRYLSPAQVALIGVNDVPNLAESLARQDLKDLRVRTKGRDFDNYSLPNLIAATGAAGGRLIVFGDFFERPPALADRYWPRFAAVEALREQATRVYEASGVGATYVLPAPVE